MIHFFPGSRLGVDDTGTLWFAPGSGAPEGRGAICTPDDDALGTSLQTGHTWLIDAPGWVLMAGFAPGARTVRVQCAFNASGTKPLVHEREGTPGTWLDASSHLFKNGLWVAEIPRLAQWQRIDIDGTVVTEFRRIIPGWM